MVVFRFKRLFRFLFVDVKSCAYVFDWGFYCILQCSGIIFNFHVFSKVTFSYFYKLLIYQIFAIAYNL